MALRVYMNATFDEAALAINYYEKDKAIRNCSYRKYCGNCYDAPSWNRNFCYEFKSVYYLKYKGIDKQIRYFLLDSNTGENLLNEVKEECTKNEHKSIVFVDSKKNGEKLKNMINKEFMSDKSQIAEYIDADTKDGGVFSQIVNESKFDCKILITTWVLDNGVNIEDKDLDSIYILDLDKVGSTQAIGRKRFKKGDVFNVHIISLDKEYLNKKLTLVKNDLNEYEKIKENPAQYVYNVYDSCSEQYHYLNIVRKIDDKWSYNNLAYVRLKYKEKVLYELINSKNQADCISKILKWYDNDNDINIKYLGYTQNEIKMYKLLEYYANLNNYSFNKDKFINDFMEFYLERFGKDSSDRSDRKDANTVKRANNKLIRLRMPFIFKETGDYIFVEYNQEDNVTNVEGGKKLQENNTVIRGKDENL